MKNHLKSFYFPHNLNNIKGESVRRGLGHFFALVDPKALLKGTKWKFLKAQNKILLDQTGSTWEEDLGRISMQTKSSLLNSNWKCLKNLNFS